MCFFTLSRSSENTPNHIILMLLKHPTLNVHKTFYASIFMFFRRLQKYFENVLETAETVHLEYSQDTLRTSKHV